MTFGYRRIIEGSAGQPNETAFLQIDSQESAQIAASNGTTTFDAILSGTPMGKITASSRWRPCGKQIVHGAYGPGVVIPMQSVQGFEVGDVVTVYDVSGSTTLATARTVNSIDAGASPPTITISGANVSVDPGDYVFVEDGSGTARGLLRAGVYTLDAVDANGVPLHNDQGGLIVFRGVAEDSVVDSKIKLNALIRADLENAANCCQIILK